MIVMVIGWLKKMNDSPGHWVVETKQTCETNTSPYLFITYLCALDVFISCFM